MFGRPGTEDKVNKFTVTQKEHSIYYGLEDPTELKGVEISDDLYRAKFYYSLVGVEEGEGNYELAEEVGRIRGVVSSSVYPPLPELGHVASDQECVEIYGLLDFSVMHTLNRQHIEKQYSIEEQLHPLEWILTKARNSGVLPQALYDRVRIDVRHRAMEIREVTKANQDAAKVMRDEIARSYAPDANFKAIKTSVDTYEFAGQIVAYLSDSYYFSNGEDAVTLPVEVSGHKVRFAKLHQMSDPWQGGERGFDMDCFLKPECNGSTNALIDSRIKGDNALAMRLATVQELQFLKLTLELDQGRLRYRRKEEDINMLDGKIAQAISAKQDGVSTPSRFSLFTPRKGAAIPEFTPYAGGTVDWSRDGENKDKSLPPKPSTVFLIKGGDEESRKQKAYDLVGQEGGSMYGVYYSKDKSECAVVFSREHDTFNLMSFAVAKKLAGEQQLPDDFSINIFSRSNQSRSGVVNLGDALRPSYLKM